MRITPSSLVRRFYDEVWNGADAALARAMLHRDFRFRGSLGPESRGVEPFIAYMTSVHAALGDYHCRIDELLEHGARAVARMTFSGLHRGTFFGVPATGRNITWSGAAFFTTASGCITSLWVLGDVDTVKRQLGLVDTSGPLD